MTGEQSVLRAVVNDLKNIADNDVPWTFTEEDADTLRDLAATLEDLAETVEDETTEFTPLTDSGWGYTLPDRYQG